MEMHYNEKQHVWSAPFLRLVVTICMGRKRSAKTKANIACVFVFIGFTNNQNGGMKNAESKDKSNDNKNPINVKIYGG